MHECVTGCAIAVARFVARFGSGCGYQVDFGRSVAVTGRKHLKGSAAIPSNKPSNRVKPKNKNALFSNGLAAWYVSSLGPFGAGLFCARRAARGTMETGAPCPARGV